MSKDNAPVSSGEAGTEYGDAGADAVNRIAGRIEHADPKAPPEAVTSKLAKAIEDQFGGLPATNPFKQRVYEELQKRSG